MSNITNYNFDLFIKGKKIDVFSLQKGQRNDFNNYMDRLDIISQKKLIARIERIANNYGFDSINPENFKWLVKYTCLGEIKINNPSHRLLVTKFSNNLLIILFGFPKRSNKSTKLDRIQYDKAQKIIHELMEDKNGLERKYKQILKKIQK